MGKYIYENINSQPSIHETMCIELAPQVELKIVDSNDMEKIVKYGIK